VHLVHLYHTGRPILCTLFICITLGVPFCAHCSFVSYWTSHVVHIVHLYHTGRPILCTLFICIILGVPFCAHCSFVSQWASHFVHIVRLYNTVRPIFPQRLPQAAVLLIYVREVTVQNSRRSKTTLITSHRFLSQSLPTPGILRTTSIAKFYVLLTVHLDTSVCK